MLLKQEPVELWLVAVVVRDNSTELCWITVAAVGRL
ncbi:unnamed protein product [Brugia timori]|uniref:Uncharacterized protein n=1 Tax=Brugia timori TaxID=42155 RepID=A0A3P7TJS6_9BILA|nr:unnamed protein product [Brugia timori]